MSSIPDFKASVAKLARSLVSKECKDACKKLKDADKRLSRDTIEKYSIEEKYEEVVKECPLLMSVLFAASCSKSSVDIKVKNYAWVYTMH